MKVDFYKHQLGDEEKQIVVEALSKPILTTGEYSERAEILIKEYTGSCAAVALDSCTAALQLGLTAVGVGPGDEVITTPMTFLASSNAILQTGAKPVFVDVLPESGLISPERVEAAVTSKTKAILPVHLYGNMCDMRALRNIADRHSIFIIEDAAHCIEGERDGCKVGELGDAAALSFYATKNICCGEGGMLISRNQVLANQVRAISCHGITKTLADRYGTSYQHWDMERFGWKYNLDNIRASLLIPQIGKLDARQTEREKLCQRYEASFANASDLGFPKKPKNSRSGRHLQTVWVPESIRDQVIRRLQETNIGVAVNYRSVTQLSWYKENFNFKDGDFPIAEEIGNRTLTLPLYPGLTEQEQDYVIDNLTRIVNTETSL